MLVARERRRKDDLVTSEGKKFAFSEFGARSHVPPFPPSQCMLSMGFLTLLLHVFIVLFGAPLTVEVNETFHLAALAASLSLWPCIFTYGLQWESWVTSICVFEGSPLTGDDSKGTL